VIPFTASDQWIKALLEQASEISFTQPREVAHAQQCFLLILQLFHHDSLQSERAYLNEISLMTDQGQSSSYIVGLKRWAHAISIDDFMRSGANFTRFPVALRSGGMRIATDNVFSADFSPPTAARAKAALRTLLQFSGLQFEEREGTQDVVGVALAAYCIFLTIHPFNDGNGRTARFYFAACISSFIHQCPFLLLALAMVHRNRGAAFHMATKIARLGDLSALAEIYKESIALAISLFEEDIGVISENPSLAVVAGSKELDALLRLRGRISSYLLL